MSRQFEPWRDEIMPAATRRNTDLRRLWSMALSLPGGTFEAARHCQISQHQMMEVFCGKLPAAILVNAIPRKPSSSDPVPSVSLLEIRWKNLVEILESRFNGSIDAAAEATNLLRPVWVGYLMGLKRISEGNARDFEDKLGLVAHGLEIIDGQVAATPEERKTIRASNMLRLYHCLETKYANGQAILDCLSNNKQAVFLATYNVVRAASWDMAGAGTCPPAIEDVIVPLKNRVTVAVCRVVESALGLKQGAIDQAIPAPEIESIAKRLADNRAFVR